MGTIVAGIAAPRQRLKEYCPGSDIIRIANYFGLAMKAGLVAAGDSAAAKALKTGEAHLLVLARDTSPAVVKEITPLAEKRSLPVLWWPDKESLGLAVGKSRRGALALLDSGFSKTILKFCDFIE